MKGNTVNRFSGIFTAVLAVILLISASTFPERAASAALYVKFLGVCLIIFSALLVAETFMKSDDKEREALKEKVIVWIKAPKPFLITAVALILYVSSLGILGFFPASMIFMPVLGYLLGFKKKIPLVIGSAGLLIFIYVVFVYFLTVPVPMGFLEGVL